MIGQNIGKYRVLERVGRGGMGTVYRAIDETLHREVAIKVLNAELNDPEVARRFRTEAITVARLSHPGIATIYELFQHDGQWLMVMEFVRGETLEQLVANAGPLTPERAAALCMQALAALAHAHSMGVVHRDLKPANVMLTSAGDVKVMDFGIARVAGSEHLTSVGFMMGTPAYMAPEQVLGQEIDARADLYAVGVVLFRLLTGVLPFKGDTPFALAQAQVNAPPTPIASVRANLPDWVGAVLARALEKQPEARFQSAAEFHDALDRAVGGAETVSTYDPPTPACLPAASVSTLASGAHGRGTASAGESGAQPGRLVAGSVAAAATVASPTPGALVRDRLPVPTPVPGSEPLPAADRPAGSARPQPSARRTPRYAAAAVVLLVLAGAGVWYWSSSASVAPNEPTADLAPLPPPSIDPVPVPDPLPETTTASSSATQVAAPTATAAAATEARTLAPARGGRPTADAPADTAPAVDVSNVRVMVLEGRRAQDVEAQLTFGNGRIAALQRDGDATLLAWPYARVERATYVYARNPRWDASLASPPDNLDVGGVFRSSRHWLTLQNADEFVILRLEDINVIQVIREIEARTGLTIRRTAAGSD
jgi:hypothetical protein